MSIWLIMQDDGQGGSEEVGTLLAPPDADRDELVAGLGGAPNQYHVIFGGHLRDGYIAEGDTCPFSDKCDCKESACNGNGCPVSDGKRHTVDFSCAIARFYELF